MTNHLKKFSFSALMVIFLLFFIIINPNTGFDILAFLLILFIILQKIFGEYFILILLAMRPTLDYWRDFIIFSVGLIDFNINASLSVFLLLWSIIFFIKNYECFKRVPLKIPWLLFILWCAISLTYTYHASSTIIETMKLANLFALFGITYILTEKDKSGFKNKFLKSAVAAATVPLLFGLYQFISRTGMDIDEVSNRIYGTLAHPNVLATFTLLLLMVLANEIIAKQKKTDSLLSLKNNTLPKLLIFFLLAIIAFTYTRIAWIGAAILFIIIGIVYYKKTLLYSLTGIILFFSLFYPINHFLISTYNINLQSIGLISRLTTRNEDSDSVRWRTELTAKVLPLFKKKYIAGYGYGTFARVWDDNKDITNLWDNTSEAHNDYIKIAFESGIIGLFLFLTIFAVLLYKQIIFALRNNWKNIIFIASILVYLILSFSDNMLHHTPTIWWFWAVWGYWCARFKVENEK